ncbi:adenine DNA glycosylase [Klebsiella pneumoniae]|nr:adenine DNA glycosylase [Klebsiella pneumoniae]
MRSGWKSARQKGFGADYTVFRSLQRKTPCTTGWHSAVSVTHPYSSHTFSHFHLDIVPVAANVTDRTAVHDDSDGIWYNSQNPPVIGLAAPVETLLKQIG